jgi:hypothetical protein
VREAGGGGLAQQRGDDAPDARQIIAAGGAGPVAVGASWRRPALLVLLILPILALVDLGLWCAPRGIRTPNRQIRSLVLCVDLVGSRPIWAAQVGCLVDPDGSRTVPSDRLDDQTDDQAPRSLPRHSRRHVGPGDRILNLAIDPHEVMRVTRREFGGRPSSHLGQQQLLQGKQLWLGGSPARNRVSRRRSIGALSDAGAAAAP